MKRLLFPIILLLAGLFQLWLGIVGNSLLCLVIGLFYLFIGTQIFFDAKKQLDKEKWEKLYNERRNRN